MCWGRYTPDTHQGLIHSVWCTCRSKPTYFILYMNVSSSLHQFHNRISLAPPSSYDQGRLSILHKDNVLWDYKFIQHHQHTCFCRFTSAPAFTSSTTASVPHPEAMVRAVSPNCVMTDSQSIHLILTRYNEIPYIVSDVGIDNILYSACECQLLALSVPQQHHYYSSQQQTSEQRIHPTWGWCFVRPQIHTPTPTYISPQVHNSSCF